MIDIVIINLKYFVIMRFIAKTIDNNVMVEMTSEDFSLLRNACHQLVKREICETIYEAIWEKLLDIEIKAMKI